MEETLLRVDFLPSVPPQLKKGCLEVILNRKKPGYLIFDKRSMVRGGEEEKEEGKGTGLATENRQQYQLNNELKKTFQEYPITDMTVTVII
jgi:hypothetical protein